MGIYEIGDSGGVRTLSTWNHFFVLGQQHLKSIPWGAQGQTQVWLFEIENQWVGWQGEAIHQLGSWTIISCTWGDGQARLKTRHKKNWPYSFRSFTRHKEEIIQRWNSLAGSDSCPSIFLVPCSLLDYLTGVLREPALQLKIREEYSDSLCVCYESSQEEFTHYWKW